MHFTKPAWVAHTDSSAKDDRTAKRLSIFSVDVHPDGSRIATGGLDAKVRIWSTKPILNSASEHSNKPPKSLCTLTMHTGPVLVVRWAHSGRWLASGSDDAIVMVWDLDPAAKSKVWGSDEVNVEGWKPLKRLPGHESDITDIAWSPGDRYLASVGLDSMVFIWCGYTLERLHKLDQHQGFVKGVCWDPVGEFLATQSDDRSVKIWRTGDWGLEAEVTKPFEDSPGSTFFRRLSWSPDGAHITASNATNNKGFVFIAAVITRNSWTSEISLVGHENTIEVAAYNPHIFLRNPGASVTTSNICSVVALGADDRSVSIWQTKSARPLIVAKEVFERQIMDLSWSRDGLTLYAASSDGTLAVFNFDEDELEGIAPLSVQEKYLQKFGFSLPPLPEGFSHSVPARDAMQITPPASPSSKASQPPSDFGHSANGTGERVNVLVAKRSNKGKRRAPLNQADIPSASTAGPSSSAKATAPPSRTFSNRNWSSETKESISHAPSSKSAHFPAPEGQPFNVPENWTRPNDMDVDVPIDSLDTSSTRGKRKAVIDLTDDSRPAKMRTLGGDTPRTSVAVRELGSSSVTTNGFHHHHEFQAAPLLPSPPLLTFLSSKVEGTEDVFEARNFEGSDPTEVAFVNGKATHWLDYVPAPVLQVKATSLFCAAALQDGSVHVYSATGRRLMPAMTLGAPCYKMDANKSALLVLTTIGNLYVWNIKKQSAFFPSVSVRPLLASPNNTITAAIVRSNGAPIIICSSAVYTYDSSLLTWVILGDRWWSEGSDAWQGRQRGNASSGSRGILSTIESTIGGGDETAAEVPRPQWWSTALTLGHMETRLHAARLLDSQPEYKQSLLVYAKKIADEGFRAKAEELVKELFGPIFWRPGRDDSWTPTILGMAKRDLLKDVLSIFARSKTLTKLALDWQDTLKKAANEEQP
ncbi:HIR complex subunit [Pleurotus ostreatus]|uniref:Protein HIR n=1 Tax=Pleurotus ostreatus TaxID=5322 RepID=A0A8H6ZUY2_PLEOS|nr:HIR complex subunit [Pleurotus ostreatus]KAF7427978.1 HIR complex subunit [Pleurotus ostreatus]KAJ8696010.1 HIR complex subunit [Pleurotus ostreatus]